MPWTRVGDSAATYPKLMQTAGHRGADERTVNEVAGWLLRCAFQSAAHMTDYSIDAGTAWMLGGARTEELVRVCLRAGLLEEVKDAGMKGYRLIDDPEFIHIRLRKEVEWERQQRNDTRDPRLRVPVLLRDGDQCRYCAVVVMWRGKTSNRSGSLDHRTPGEAGTVETMVVACMRCNSARNDNPQWDDDNPLLPVPLKPVFGKFTAQYLTINGHPTEQNMIDEKRPARAPGADTAPTGVRPATAACDDTAQRPARAPGADTAPTGVRPATAAPAEPARLTPLPHCADVTPNSSSNSDGRPDRTGVPGSGLVGLGLVGLGSGTSVPEPGSPQARRRRGRRGRRPPAVQGSS